MFILGIVIGLFAGAIIMSIVMAKRCKHEWEDVGHVGYTRCIDYHQKCTKCNNMRSYQL